VTKRHVVAMLLARALLGLLLALIAAIAGHAGGGPTACEPVWTADHQVYLSRAGGRSEVSQIVHTPNAAPTVGFGPLVFLSLGRLTSWSRS
jgi:hypothetical protein